MPYKTYLHLPRKKKTRIFNAGLREFSTNPKHDASINTIVKTAKISKGSFYQYFKNKDAFYWYIVRAIMQENTKKYRTLLKINEGNLFETERDIFKSILDLFNNERYKNFMIHVFKDSFVELQPEISAKAQTIYFDMYDILVKYGFKGYNIKTKNDFRVVFSMIRNITNSTILKYISDDLSIGSAIRLYDKKLDYLEKGILKRGLFG
ncbi:MAG: TetR/AcrR family transcriptional regulator [Candidatus Izimaplasma sp.]|nr:TetR/AcrR family transcriptional regulator [Candidatus Izimaplasma bacterium]